MIWHTPQGDADAFCARLIAARRAVDISQSELAGMLDIPLAVYLAWETGGATPDRITLYRRLCDKLEVNVNWLFFGDTSGMPVPAARRLKRSFH